MEPQNATNPASVARKTGFGNANWLLASDHFLARQTLEIQAEKIARQFNLPPATARLTASLAFGEGAR